MTGTLVLIGTPIGNLDDISKRVLDTLGSLDALACEDTRHTRKIYEHFSLLSPRTIFSSMYSANEAIAPISDHNHVDGVGAGSISRRIY